MIQKEFVRLRERLSDPLLTALTVMLAVLMFVVGPLQAVGVFGAHHFGLAFGLMLVVSVFVVSGSVVALTATLFAVALVVVATILTIGDRYLSRRVSLADRWPDARHRCRPRRVRTGEGQPSPYRRCHSTLPRY